MLGEINDFSNAMYMYDIVYFKDDLPCSKRIVRKYDTHHNMRVPCE